MRSPAFWTGTARVVAGGGLPECANRADADRRDQDAENTYAPAACSAGRTGMREQAGFGATIGSGRATAGGACGGGLRIVVRIKHVPASGRVEVNGSDHPGNRHYACRPCPRKP
jgi:hypothetical protein